MPASRIGSTTPVIRSALSSTDAQHGHHVVLGQPPVGPPQAEQGLELVVRGEAVRGDQDVGRRRSPWGRRPPGIAGRRCPVASPSTSVGPGRARRPSSPSSVLPGTVLLVPSPPARLPTGATPLHRDGRIVQLLEPRGHRRGLLLGLGRRPRLDRDQVRSSRRAASRTSWVTTSSGSDRGSSTVSRTSRAWTRPVPVDGLAEVVGLDQGQEGRPLDRVAEQDRLQPVPHLLGPVDGQPQCLEAGPELRMRSTARPGTVARRSVLPVVPLRLGTVGWTVVPAGVPVVRRRHRAGTGRGRAGRPASGARPGGSARGGRAGQPARAGSARPPASRTGRGPGRRGARPPPPARGRPPGPGPRASTGRRRRGCRSTRNCRKGLAPSTAARRAAGSVRARSAGSEPGGRAATATSISRLRSHS